jgi:UDP-glucuronate decarboxylase
MTGVLCDFIIQTLLSRDITVGKGQQTRSFCYVDDLVDGLIKLQSQIFSLVT